jgi:hypothetical protein
VSCGPPCWAKNDCWAKNECWAKIKSDSVRMVCCGLRVYGWCFSPKTYLSCAKRSRL